VAFADVIDLMVDSVPVEEVHKAVVEAVVVSLVATLLPFSLLLSSLILQRLHLLWAVLPVAVDSSRRFQCVERRNYHQLIKIYES
jgi:hypothetical protein